MARLKKNLIIKEIEGVPNLLEVWTPTPAKAKKLIEAIEGVVRVNHFVDKGRLSVWFNPCYGKTELKAEIRAALSEQRWATSLHAQRERRRRHRTTRPYLTGRTIADMRLGEIGYVVPWAVDDWDWLSTHLDGLNLAYSVHPAPFGTIDTPICRTETGWVVGGKIFAEGAQDVFGGTIAAMRPGEAE